MADASGLSGNEQRFSTTTRSAPAIAAPSASGSSGRSPTGSVARNDRGAGDDELGRWVDVHDGHDRDTVAADAADLGAGNVDGFRGGLGLADGVERGVRDELRPRRTRDRTLRVPGVLAVALDE